MSDWLWVAAMLLMWILGLVIGITLPPVDAWPTGAQMFWRGFTRGFTFGAYNERPDRWLD